MEKLTFRQAKSEAIRQWWCYQRGANDVSGYERDCEWRAEVRSARSWDALHAALPWGHPYGDIAANRGRRS